MPAGKNGVSNGSGVFFEIMFSEIQGTKGARESERDGGRGGGRRASGKMELP